MDHEFLKVLSLRRELPRIFLTFGAFGAHFSVLALGAALIFAYAAPSAAATAAQVSVEVPKGKTKSVRMRNLPRGALVSAKVSASGNLQIALISAAQLKSRRPEALFRGALDSSLSFRVILPESSDYYLVLDNRLGTEPIKTRATIKVEKKSEPEQRDIEHGDKFEETRATRPPPA